MKKKGLLFTIIALLIFDALALLLDVYYIRKYIPYNVAEQLGDMWYGITFY